MIFGKFSRRSALTGAAAFGAAGASVIAVTEDLAQTRTEKSGQMPARDDVVIRNAYVMTMDKAGDIENGDVHVSDGVIVAVGQKLDAAGASEIDGNGWIVLPGLVETHWHMWNTLLRSLSGDNPERGYFRTTAILGQKYEPDDMYQGTRLAAAKQSTPVSPMSTVGATTYVRPSTPRRISGRSRNPDCGHVFPTARARASQTAKW